MAVTTQAIPSTATRVRSLAREHGVSYQPTYLDRWADKMNELSDSPGELDEPLKLIIALERENAISPEEAVSLIVAHVKET